MFLEHGINARVLKVDNSKSKFEINNLTLIMITYPTFLCVSMKKNAKTFKCVFMICKVHEAIKYHETKACMNIHK